MLNKFVQTAETNGRTTRLQRVGRCIRWRMVATNRMDPTTELELLPACGPMASVAGATALASPRVNVTSSRSFVKKIERKKRKQGQGHLLNRGQASQDTATSRDPDPNSTQLYPFGRASSIRKAPLAALKQASNFKTKI